MDKVVVAVLLIALAIASAIAVAAVIQKQWTSSSQVYTIDTEGSSIALDSAGVGTITLLLHNTGTTTAYISRITIVPSKVEVYFVDGQAWITGWPAGSPRQATAMNASSSKVEVSSSWVVIPSSESIYLTFVFPGMSQVMSVGTRYTASIYPLQNTSGSVQTFSITVESS